MNRIQTAHQADRCPVPRTRGDESDDGVDLGVTSRQVVWLLLEQLRFEFVPVFHGLQGRFSAQG